MAHVNIDAHGSVTGYSKHIRARTPGPNPQVCCRLPNTTTNTSANTASSGSSGSSVHCLPSFIIAGTQKSGTTALSALLVQHPRISFAKRKELHYFDSSKYRSSNSSNSSNSSLSDYLFAFPAWNHSSPQVRAVVCLSVHACLSLPLSSSLFLSHTLTLSLSHAHTHTQTRTHFPPPVVPPAAFLRRGHACLPCTSKCLCPHTGHAGRRGPFSLFCW
eukprot:GSChrysophyteH1.ASY1.ANO1.1591.1 assembled CDS